MNDQRDEAGRLRINDANRGDEPGRSRGAPSLGLPCLLARTTKIATYPIAAQGFYACTPLTVLGPEVEGGAGTIIPGSSTFFALNVGSAIPPVGASILTTFVDNRWVFRYDG